MPTRTETRPAVALPTRPFRTVDAGKLGISPWQLLRLVHEGEARRVLQGVYVSRQHSDTIELRAEALALVAPPHAVICDRTAAWLWGVDALRRWELEMTPCLDVYVLRGRTRVRRPQAGGGERDLRAEDLVPIGDILVTTPVRTSLDLACRLSRYEGLAVMDAFARTHGADSTELAALLPRYRGRRGVVQARRLVPLVDARAESTGESFTRLAIHDRGLPAPKPQHWVNVSGVPTYRLDLAYPALKICIEYDGEEFHSSDEARDNDRRRRQWLRDHGWKVIVVRKGDFKGLALETWLDELGATLAERMG
jgi:hypothetical protein